MLFDIEDDDGTAVSGWVVPDNPASVPSVTVAREDGERIEIFATKSRPALRARGLHRTGLCGFTLDGRTCPGLRPWEAVALFDTYSHTLLYRRPRGLGADIRLFHLETDPRQGIGAEIGRRFHMCYGSAEMIGEETLTGILGIGFTSSLLVAGAVHYRRIEPLLRTAGFRRSTLLRDPLRGLAATLLGLKAMARLHGGEGGWRSLGRRELVATFAAVDLTDPRALATTLGRLEVEQSRLLADPITRRLATRLADQHLEDEHVGLALDALAAFDVIGFDDQPDTFTRALDELIGDGEVTVPARLPTADLAAVEAALAGCEPARALVALDEAVVSAARAAVGSAGPEIQPAG